MHQLQHFTPLCLFLSLYFFSSLNVGVAGTGENPFSPKAYLVRYWKKQISNHLPQPAFLLNKASPLTAVESATFTKLAAQNALSTKITSFCSSAKLLCFPDLSPSLEKHDQNVNFNSYLDDRNFNNYGKNHINGFDSFKNYTLDSFRSYSRAAVSHDDKFDNYAMDANVADQNFNTYGTSTTGGAGDFKNYAHEINVPNLHFTSYSADTEGRQQTFTAYSDDSNAGDQYFTNYGKSGNNATNQFTTYGKDTNVMGSTFSGYGQNANSDVDTFTSYSTNGNDPKNTFKMYGVGGKVAVDTFSSYRDGANVGDDSFKSYAKNSNGGKVNFVNYGKSFNMGTDTFATYGTHGAAGQQIGFKIYGVNNTFKDYQDKKKISFSQYTKKDPTMGGMSGREIVNKWIEPGKFFRERMLKMGVVMPMPDIRDKMPQRAFLPRVILSKLPFSTSKVGELKEIFHARENSSMSSMIENALSECERVPSRDETKRCVGSVEDMIDFATSVLGRNVVVRTTESTQGSKQNVMVGSVKAINGGKVTKSVSCHQSLFPYLLYYCHSVPKVRVYQADLLDLKSKSKINHGVAICHVDTSAWSAAHGAFMALGSGPGKIEVCHWIFENDMTWALAD